MGVVTSGILESADNRTGSESRLAIMADGSAARMILDRDGRVVVSRALSAAEYRAAVEAVTEYVAALGMTV